MKINKVLFLNLNQYRTDPFPSFDKLRYSKTDFTSNAFIMQFVWQTDSSVLITEVFNYLKHFLRQYALAAWSNLALSSNLRR